MKPTRAQLSAHGLEVISTGGNCEGYSITLRDGREILVTDGDAGLPEDGEPFIVSVYCDQGHVLIQWEAIKDGRELASILTAPGAPSVTAASLGETCR
jgi:hypothetical protein